MNKRTVGIISNNRRLRVAYRLLLEEVDRDVEVIWDTLLGEELKTYRKSYEPPSVLLVDYTAIQDQASFDLEDLKYIFPESSFLFVCDDAPIHEDQADYLHQFVLSKYCSAQTLSSVIAKVGSFPISSQKGFW